MCYLRNLRRLCRKIGRGDGGGRRARVTVAVQVVLPLPVGEVLFQRGGCCRVVRASMEVRGRARQLLQGGAAAASGWCGRRWWCGSSSEGGRVRGRGG
jgi:hypothetical protein